MKRISLSLYADDATAFLAPIKRDVDNLASILRGFGEAMGLCTNFHKSSLVPIHCNHLNLGRLTQGLPATRASASGQSTIWFFLTKNLVQSFLADSLGC